MINDGVVKKTGKSKATRYHITTPPLATAIDADKKPEIIPLSEESKEILVSVSLPEAMRTPVSYNRDFLRSYRPNHSSYLRAEEKAMLAQTGKIHNVEQPAGTYGRNILERLLIDLSWNSSRLEGNTYSLLETTRLIEAGELATAKSAEETQMILNHKDAIEFITDGDETIGFNRTTILNLHAMLSNNLLADPGASGRLRRIPVAIKRSVYLPLAIPQQIEEFFEIILDKARDIKDPFEQAFFMMVHLPYLQAFDDVNKRVSRLAANIPFIKNNLSPLSFIDVPEDTYIQGTIAIYELNRVQLLKDVFIWAYRRSAAGYVSIRQSLGEPDRFKLQYRGIIIPLITEIIFNSLSPFKATTLIAERSLQVPAQDQKKFIETVESEISSLHEGNYARYRVSLKEFNDWKHSWSVRG
jgi:hypothetical protein